MKRALVIAIWAMTALIFCLLFMAHRQQGKSDWDFFHALLFSPLFGVVAVVVVLRRVLDYIRQVKPPSLERGEGLIHAGWVTYPLGWDLVGGALYVTTRKIIFCPSRVNFHKVDFDTPINQVSDAHVVKSRFGMNYRLAITDSAGHRTEFIIGRCEKSLGEKIMSAREGG